MALPSNLLETTQAHLEQFISDQSQEGPHLDFKRDIPTNWDNSTKHEFLADASAFANAGGGDIVYGVAENADAQASALVPQAVASIDQEVRRMQDFLLNSVEPRLPGVQVHPVAVNVGGIAGHAVVLRIPQSWVGPHRVKTNQHFYVRDSLRKRQLDLPEIKGLFLKSDSQAQKVKDFRTDRLAKILSGDGFHKLVDGPTLVIHLVPSQAALGQVQVNPLMYAYGYANTRRVPILGSSMGIARVNLDGALAIRNPTQGHTHGYSQFFRDGFFESVTVLPRPTEASYHVLGGRGIAQYILQLLRQVRAELRELGYAADMAVMLSILRAKQVELGVDRFHEAQFDYQGFFDRDVVALPDVATDEEVSPEQATKPVLDLLWQAAGFTGCSCYDDQGNWIQGR